jgi:hypothetical protein
LYRQALTVGYEAGGPRIGRCVATTFKREGDAAAAKL